VPELLPVLEGLAPALREPVGLGEMLLLRLSEVEGV
jgi:hypothetical protein